MKMGVLVNESPARAIYVNFLSKVLPYPLHWYDGKTDKELCAIYNQQRKKLDKRADEVFDADDSRIRSVLSEVINPVTGPDDMPKTPDGKIDFVKLRERYPVSVH